MSVIGGRLYPFRLALKSPLVTGQISVRHRAGLLVALTSEGQTGWGEASPLPGWSRTTLLQTEAALRHGVQRLSTAASDLADDITSVAVRAAQPGLGPSRRDHRTSAPNPFNDVVEALSDTPHARAAIVGAWYDLQARQAGLSLAQYYAQFHVGRRGPHSALAPDTAAKNIREVVPQPGCVPHSAPAFGSDVENHGEVPPLGCGSHSALAFGSDVENYGEVPPLGCGSHSALAFGSDVENYGEVPPLGCGSHSAPAPGSDVAVNALVVALEPHEVEQAAHDAVTAGYKAVKLKVGAVSPDKDVERVRAARRALGPDPELRLDANGVWDAHTALEVLSRVQNCDIAYCEEPVTGIEALAAVDRQTAVPVAVDESMRDIQQAAQALELGLKTLIVKPQALGGPDIALSIADRAQQVGASVVVTSFIDSAVGLAHTLHVAAEVDACALHRRAHGLATSEFLASDVAEPPVVSAGVMALPAGTGIGLEPIPDRLPSDR